MTVVAPPFAVLAEKKQHGCDKLRRPYEGIVISSRSILAGG